MQYAIDSTGNKIQAHPHLEGKCTCCQSWLIPKCGKIKIWHWSHQVDDCDPWYEPESEWHRGWKNLVPAKMTEVVIGNHRADIVSTDGTVVELQHSSISPQEIQEREEFYKDMVWLFDAIKMHIELREKWFDEEGYRTFRWKWPRRTLSFGKSPMYFDMGNNQIFEMKKVNFNSQYVGGWGFLISKEEMLKRIIEP